MMRSGTHVFGESLVSALYSSSSTWKSAVACKPATAVYAAHDNLYEVLALHAGIEVSHSTNASLRIVNAVAVKEHSVLLAKTCSLLWVHSRDMDFTTYHQTAELHLPGWLGRANMLPSLIAKLALCCKMRSSRGFLAGLT